MPNPRELAIGPAAFSGTPDRFTAVNPNQTNADYYYRRGLQDPNQDNKPDSCFSLLFTSHSPYAGIQLEAYERGLRERLEGTGLGPKEINTEVNGYKETARESIARFKKVGGI